MHTQDPVLVWFPQAKQASFKVYVILTSGNEAASNELMVTRPV